MHILGGITISSVCLLLGMSSMLAQSRPDLSGSWELQGAEGVGRGGVKGSVHVLEVSGGAFNCGRICTIIHARQSLTVSRLADDKAPKRQDVVLAIGGVTGSAEARWDGDKLVVSNSLGVITTKQTIARQGNKLKVTSWIVAPGADPSPVVQTYIKR